MKQVIFICLLSISLCLSAPENGKIPDSTKHDNAPITTEKSAAAAANLPGAEVTPAPQGNGPSVAPQNQTATTEASGKDKGNLTTQAPTTHVTETANLTTTEKTPLTTSSTVQTTTAAATVSTTNSSFTKPTPSMEPEHKATVPPKTPEPIPVHARGFDGASFVGGIILTLGLLAIGFMGFKYYKNQTERNYHTL